MSVVRICLPVLILVMCAILRTKGTELTRVPRTLPINLFPKTLSRGVGNLLAFGRFWQWPGNTASNLLRLIASPDTRKKQTFEFRPEDGKRAAYAYQQRYGYRGEWLIELLGAGYHPDVVSRQWTFYQPLPASVLTPPPPVV